MDRTRRNLLIGGSLVGAAIASGVVPAMCSWRGNDSWKNMAAGTPPQRPPGEPKPLMEEDMAPVLARLDAWYAAHLPADRYVFNSPAGEADLDALERQTGILLPKAYRQLYRWHDGEDDDRWGHIYGLPLLPLAQARAQWQVWMDGLASFGGNRYAIPGGSWPEGAVDPAYINPRWLPLTHDGSGNHIGLDFAPWPRGRVGQVILFGRDEDVKAVLADSLGQFLAWIADLLEGGNFRLTARPGDPVLRQFGLREPPSGGFHAGARVLRGAPGQYL